MAEQEPRTYRLAIPGLPPSANWRRRASWPQLYRVARPFKDAATLLARQAHQGPPLERARVVATLVRRSGQPPRDPDSAVASLKEVLDGLVAGDLLDGDGPEQLELVVRQERGGRSAFVRLEITELPAEVVETPG